MKRNFFLLLTLSVSFFGFSQNEYLDYKYSFSASTHFKWYYNKNNFGMLNATNPLSGLTASFFMMDNKKNQHEFSLERLNFSTNPHRLVVNGYVYTTKQTDISIGYKYHFNFVKNRNARWIPSVGLGAHLFYANKNAVSDNQQPPISSKQNFVGLEYYVQPALTFHASKRVYLNLSFPIHFISTGINFWETINPSTPPYKLNGARFDLGTGFNQFQAKFGVGIKF